MSRRQADVLVEVKCLDSGPVDVLCLRQSMQELKLRRGSSGDDPCPAVLRNGAADRGRSLLRSGVSQRDFIFEYFEQHTDILAGRGILSRGARASLHIAQGVSVKGFLI